MRYKNLISKKNKPSCRRRDDNRKMDEVSRPKSDMGAHGQQFRLNNLCKYVKNQSMMTYAKSLSVFLEFAKISPLTFKCFFDLLIIFFLSFMFEACKS
jgi:hypothetical protein